MNNDRLEKMEDLATSALVEAYINAKGCELLKLNEQLQDDQEFDYSEEAQQRILAAIDTAFDRKRRQTKLRQLRKYAARATMVAVLILTLGTITVFSVDAFRIRVLNTILEYQEDQAIMRTEEEAETPVLDIVIPRAPTWMPEGFVLTERTTGNAEHVVTLFEHEDGRWIQCTWDGSTGGTIIIDTEDPVICKEITIHGCTAVLVLKGEWRLHWIDYTLDSYITLMADSRLSEEELIAVAEGIK